MRRRGFVHRRAGQRRRRSAGCDNSPPLALGLPTLSGCAMEQERRGACARARTEEKERR